MDVRVDETGAKNFVWEKMSYGASGGGRSRFRCFIDGEVDNDPCGGINHKPSVLAHGKLPRFVPRVYDRAVKREHERVSCEECHAGRMRRGRGR